MNYARKLTRWRCVRAQRTRTPVPASAAGMRSRQRALRRARSARRAAGLQATVVKMCISKATVHVWNSQCPVGLMTYAMILIYTAMYRKKRFVKRFLAQALTTQASAPTALTMNHHVLGPKTDISAKCLSITHSMALTQMLLTLLHAILIKEVI